MKKEKKAKRGTKKEFSERRGRGQKKEAAESRQLGRGSELGVWESSSLSRYVALGKALSLSYPWLSCL